MTRLCFLDTETTSLRHDRRAWEIAVIVRDPGRDEFERVWLVDLGDLDLGNADPASLRIGRFYDRHPQADPSRISSGGHVYGEAEVLRKVEALTRSAHIVGAVPSFDAEVLSARMRANGICPSWHYHLVDVEPLAAGWLHRQAAVLENRQGTLDEAAALRETARPPWKSDDLSAALGVSADDDARHTALGDARWARDIYDAATGGRP